jgi:exodeoxyribonuclease VII large subunit
MVKKDRFSQQLFPISTNSEESSDKTSKLDKTAGADAVSGSELSHLRGAKIFSVTEITNLIKKYLESKDTFTDVWLRGEISNFILHRSGHMYFDLKDENSIVPCVMFRNANQHLKFKPEHGMKVLGFGSISLYVPHGKYQFILTDLLPDGLGALHLAYLQLKDKLSKEGLFAVEHKLSIPKMPKTIGVVTSPTGAAVRDIIHVATRRFPGIHIIISPAKVQGEGAAEEIVSGIQRLHDIGIVDLMIIGRGGGSLEDLWAFNEEVVARAIYNAKIPIISAVGHETDFTIADFVSDSRAPTPSAAAELAVPDANELVMQIDNYIDKINQILGNQIQNYKLHLNRLLDSPVFTRPTDRIDQYHQTLDNLVSAFSSNMTNYHKLKLSYMENITGKLSTLDPKAILNRGYSMTLKLPEEVLVSSTDAVTDHDKLKLILKDGAVKCEVEEKIKNEKIG